MSRPRAIWPRNPNFFTPLVITASHSAPTCLALPRSSLSSLLQLQKIPVFMVAPLTMPKRSRRSECSGRKPHFFKVLMGDFEQRLKIPPKFMKHITNKASRRVILQGPKQSSSQVEFRKTITGNFLSTGWSNFVKEHSLKEYEFLVFRYDGDLHFTVTIFDTSGCEREDVLEMKTRKKSVCKGKNKLGRRVKRFLDVNCIPQHQSSKSKSLKLLSDNKHASKQLHGRRTSPKPTRDARKEMKEIGFPIFRKPRHGTFYLSSRRPVTTIERAKAERAANTFHSSFPYTIIRMRMFPSCFARTHLPQNKTSMIIRDPGGNAWKVVYNPYREKSMYRLCGGWSAFVLGNNLEEGDFCAFELIGEFELRVHIFRVVEEITPLSRLSKHGQRSLNYILGMG